jgi:hemerythrin superfamily protein
VERGATLVPLGLLYKRLLISLAFIDKLQKKVEDNEQKFVFPVQKGSTWEEKTPFRDIP